MHLTPPEVERFYNIWFPLLHYVNQKRQIVASFPDKWVDAGVQPEDAIHIRDVLWADDSLLENFIADNPANLSTNDLALVESWKHRVTGEFFIYRYIKKYTVFLSGDSPARAYGILGLVSSIEDVIGPYLPIYVQATLLPFEGRIIYDSLLSSYPVLFGGGIRSSLNDTYRYVQESHGIITSLLPDDRDQDTESIQQGIRSRNKLVLTAFQKALGHAGLSPKMMQEHTENIADFAQRFLVSRKSPRGLLELTIADIKAYIQEKTGKTNLTSLKRFLQFLRDTDRIDYFEAEDLLDFLRKEQKRR